jgi:hypothetical protein
LQPSSPRQQMRTRAVVSLLLGTCVFVAGCGRNVTRQEAESLLARTYSNTRMTAHFECQDGQRDWLYICRMSHEPTPDGIKAGLKRTAVERVGIRSMGSFQGEPILAYRTLADQGPVLSKDEHESKDENVGMPRRKAEADAYAAKVREGSNRAVGR